jgi:hypothetical protein
MMADYVAARGLRVQLNKILISELGVQEWTRSAQQHPRRICRGSCNNSNTGGKALRMRTRTGGIARQATEGWPHNWHAAEILAKKARKGTGNEYKTTLGQEDTQSKLNSNELHLNKKAKVSFEDDLLKYKPTRGANK